MKKFVVLFLIALSSIAVNAQTKEPSKPGKNPVEKKAKPALTVEFISKGAGIDRESYTKIETFIKDHPKKPAYDVEQKGREGETKITLSLLEFSKAERPAFTDEIKKLIVKHDLVLINGAKVKAKSKANVTVQEEQASNNYRMVLSFVSKGSGLDPKAHENIMEYINKHPKKPVYETKRWGREGETDYCFHLKELTSEEQAAFIKDINKMITDKEMVFVQENIEYVKKGR